MRLHILRSGVVALAAATPAVAQFSGPSPYVQRGDSPFAGAGPFGYFHVQDFEPTTTAPGLTALNGVVTAPGVFTDSVDEDDGAVDGSGVGGHSYFSNGTASAFEFRFDAMVLGFLPTHAGLVWTDVGNVLTGTTGVGGVLFEAFDASNVSLGLQGPFTLGDGDALGGTGEDRFLGATNAAGISRIIISMNNSLDWEVDHVQYGRAVPAPGSLGMLGFGMLCLLRRRRTR